MRLPSSKKTSKTHHPSKLKTFKNYRNVSWSLSTCLFCLKPSPIFLGLLHVFVVCLGHAHVMKKHVLTSQPAQAMERSQFTARSQHPNPNHLFHCSPMPIFLLLLDSCVVFRFVQASHLPTKSSRSRAFLNIKSPIWRKKLVESGLFPRSRTVSIRRASLHHVAHQLFLANYASLPMEHASQTILLIEKPTKSIQVSCCNTAGWTFRLVLRLTDVPLVQGCN